MVQVKIIGKINSTEISINGILVKGISSYELIQRAGQLAEIKLTIPADQIDINTPCIPVLPEIYRTSYIRKETAESSVDNSAVK